MFCLKQWCCRENQTDGGENEEQVIPTEFSQLNNEELSMNDVRADSSVITPVKTTSMNYTNTILTEKSIHVTATEIEAKGEFELIEVDSYLLGNTKIVFNVGGIKNSTCKKGKIVFCANDYPVV